VTRGVSWVAAGSGLVWDEAAEQPSVAGDESVRTLEPALGPPGQGGSPASSLQDLDKGDQRLAAAEHPPARRDQPQEAESVLRWHRLQERSCVFVVEREEGYLLATVEAGDGPRRPATEASAGVVEEDGAPRSGRGHRDSRRWRRPAAPPANSGS